MDLRAITGYVAHALLFGYWVWLLSRTAPELRRGTRDRSVRVRVLLVKTAGLVLTALVVSVIHFWATHWWHVLVTVPVATAVGLWLRRTYRQLVAVPRHRLPLAQRVRRTGDFQVITAGRGRAATHRLTAVLPAPPLQAPPVGPLRPPTWRSVRSVPVRPPERAGPPGPV